ncbi:MAG TPA: hypothetical protein VK348_15210 [Planctomycetota bacterium]|nr:hypothetical protein [Planctomycetota bacterium]
MLPFRTMLAALAAAGLAAQAPTLIGLAPNVGTDIYRIETSPFSAAVVSTSPIAQLSGLDVQPGTGVLFASGGFGSNGDLFTLDPATGTTTRVGPTGFPAVPGLAFTPDGVLFGTAQVVAQVADGLIRIDPSTGAATAVGPFGGGIYSLDAIASDPQTGVLYGVSPFLNPADLVVIDANTGAATVLGQLTDANNNPAQRIVGLTIDCAGRAYGTYGSGFAVGGALLAIDLAARRFTVLGQVRGGAIPDIVAVRDPWIGSCATGGTLCGAVRPRLGTTWQTCLVRPTCSSTLHFLSFGGCGSAGPIPGGLACSGCTACTVELSPILASVLFTPPCLSVPVPNNPNLLSVVLCAQDLCVLPAQPCVCPSNAVRVVVQL